MTIETIILKLAIALIVTSVIVTILLRVYNKSITVFISLSFLGLLVPVGVIGSIIGAAGNIHLTWGLPMILAFSGIVVFNIYKQIHKPLLTIDGFLQQLAQGDFNNNALSDKSLVERKDEIGGIVSSLAIHQEALSNTAAFAKEIESGNLSADFEALSDQDALGLSINSMRTRLQMFISEMKHVVDEAAKEGKLRTRIETEDKHGAWQELGSSMNELLNSFATPLENLNTIINAMSEGDLSRRYTDDASGEIASMAGNLNAALDNINELLQQVSGNVQVMDDATEEMQVSGEEMSTNTNEIASAIAQMSNGAQTQVTKVDESSRLIEGILESSRDMSAKAGDINLAAKAGVERSERGKEMVGNVVNSMMDISNLSTKTNESIKVLTERSNQITRVLSVITDIASQTNLLALNAAIEAAQAGDAGRGFAVVAEEIRQLAEDSRKSAKEIETLVKDVQRDTSESAQLIGEVIKSVKTGEETSRETSSVFEEIFKSSTETLSYSEGILNATERQIDDINNVVSITENIVVIAEQTAAGTEEIASSASELSSGMENYSEKTQNLVEISDSLRKGLDMLKLSKGGSSADVAFKMKEAFEREKSLLDALLLYSPDAIYFKDLDSRFIRCSKSVAQLAGFTEEKELIGLSDFDLYPEEEAQVARDIELQVMRSEQASLNKISKNTMPDGSHTYVSNTKIPLYDKDKKVIGMFGISRDITDQKVIEEKATQRAILLECLMENFPEVIYFKDRESKFIKVSSKLAELWGAKNADDLIGKSDFDFFGEHAQRAFEDEQEIIRSGVPILEKVETEDLKGGQKRYVLTSKLPLKDRSGLTIGTFGMSRNITDEKNAEAKIKKQEKLLADCNEENKELRKKLGETGA